MTAATLDTAGGRPLAAPVPVHARRAGTWADIVSIGGRALRSIPREPETIGSALFIPLFFFVVNVGALQDFSERSLVAFDYKAFQLPVAIIFAVTGISRATVLVTDIQDGYFDRLLLTPVRRLPLLLGLMVADFALVCALCVPVLGLGFAAGVRFDTGIIGVLAFILLAGLWGLVFTGFPYAIALRTGNPGAVASSFLLFFPFAFLTTSTLPRSALTGWLDRVAGYNPVTYVLDALRSLISQGWEWDVLGKGLIAIGLVGTVSMSLCFAALRARLREG